MSATTSSVPEQDLGAHKRELALDVLGTIGSERNFGLMADDVIIEFPYGPSLGMPDRFVGNSPTAGGNFYEQMYVNKLEYRDGLLVRTREFWDPKRIIDATNVAYDGNLHS
jgi:hypothetical protein